MSTTTTEGVTVGNDAPDWPITENAKEYRDIGLAHLAADNPPGGLFVERNTNGLGEGQSALSVRPGAAMLDGERVELDSAVPVDIHKGDPEDRRDVVYLTTGEGGDPTVRVREGATEPFAWGSGVESGEKTIANAFRPAPADMEDVWGLVLAIIHVPRNTARLQQQAITPIRAAAPAGGVGENDPVGLRTNTNDFGDALLDAVAKADDGDVLIVPPARYEGPHTTAEIEDTSFLSIYSQRRTGRDQWRLAKPKIIQNEPMDGPYIRTLTDTSIGDLTFSKGGASTVTDGQPAIAAHKPVRIDGVVGEDLGGPVVDLRNDGTTGTDNVNNSTVTNISGKRISGDVVRAVLPTGIENINALRLHVTTANDCDGHGINLDGGFGNIAKVDHAAHGGGAIRMGGRRSWGRVAYAGDGLDHAVEWGGQLNQVDIVHLGGNTTKEEPDSKAEYPVNRAPRAYPYPSEPDISSVGEPYWIEGDVRVDGSVSVGETLSRVSRTGDQQYVPAGDFREVLFDTTDSDSLDAANLSSNGVTIPAEGTYEIICNVRVKGVPEGSRVIVRIDAGDTELARADSHAAVPGGGTLTARVSDARDTTEDPALSVGDTVTGHIWQDSGESLALRSESAETFLTVGRTG